MYCLYVALYPHIRSEYTLHIVAKLCTKKTSGNRLERHKHLAVWHERATKVMDSPPNVRNFCHHATLITFKNLLFNNRKTMTNHFAVVNQCMVQNLHHRHKKVPAMRGCSAAQNCICIKGI